MHTANPYDPEYLRSILNEHKGQSLWFQYHSGGLVFIEDSAGDLVGVVEKDIVWEVMGPDRYHVIRTSALPVQIVIEKE